MESSRFNLSGGRINAVQQETATSGVTNNDRLRESLKNKAHTFFATVQTFTVHTDLKLRVTAV